MDGLEIYALDINTYVVKYVFVIALINILLHFVVFIYLLIGFNIKIEKLTSCLNI